MEFILTSDLKKSADSYLVLGVYKNGELTHSAKVLDEKTQGAISKTLAKTHFRGILGETLPLFHLSPDVFEPVLLIGCGDKNKLTPIYFRKIVTMAIKTLKQYQAVTASIDLSELPIPNTSPAWKVKQIVVATNDALYQFDQFKQNKEPITLKKLAIHIDKSSDKKSCELAMEQGMAISSGMDFAKELGNLPSNICTPTYLADQAQQLAKKHSSLKVSVLEEEDMRKLKMGALLGVAKGSAEDAKLIVLEYNGGAKTAAPIALVGKGITFDTGGNSLKTPDNMVGMKYDMCGAASVLGTFKALLELKLPINVVGVVAAVENMPGGSAYKPEDILTTMAGLTVEVISTDAEGRLILADALTYCEKFKPEVVIDIATLTGAVVIALGVHTTGLFANNQKLADALLEAGIESNDRAWQMPIWEEYHEQLKSPFADISNVGGRAAGSITAACFLSRFTEKFAWAHLDIAGTAGMGMSANERMGSGRPVPLLTQYLIDRSQ